MTAETPLDLEQLKERTGLVPSDAELHKLIDAGKSFADKMVPGEVDIRPQVLVLGRDHTPADPTVSVFCIAVPFNSHIEKRAAMLNCGRAFYDAGKAPMAVMLISEAWVSLEEHGAATKYLLPEDDPERREVVIVTALNCLRQSVIWERDVRRDSWERMRWTGDWRCHTDGEFPLLMAFYDGWLNASQMNQAARR